MLAVHIPNLLPYSLLGKHMSWMHPAGRLIWAVVLLLIGLAAIVVLARRPKPVEPPTWAQAMLGALGAFALMLIAYGTIPHEWIIFANSYLRWSAAKFIFQKNRFIHFDVTKQIANDGIAALIYVVMLVANIKIFAMWQSRPVAAPASADATAAEPQPAGTSAYGRPVTARG
jgi:small-conductance mechanosensitive channel